MLWLNKFCNVQLPCKAELWKLSLVYISWQRKVGRKKKYLIYLNSLDVMTQSYLKELEMKYTKDNVCLALIKVHHAYGW